MFDPAIPDAIASALARLGVNEVQRAPAGMSGASVFRCQMHGGEALALKCWPAGTSSARIAKVRQLTAYARQHGCHLVPALRRFPIDGHAATTLHTHAGRHWELAQWMPGQSLAADARCEEIRRGASAIALFHAAVRPLGHSLQRPPAAIARLDRVAQLGMQVPRAIEMLPRAELAAPLGGVLTRAADLLRLRWHDASARIVERLSNYADGEVSTQYVLRDIHRDHLLFDSGKPVGLVDFDAVRIDTPATDLSRWAMSFLVNRERADVEAVWEAALAGFCDENALIRGCSTELDPKIPKDLCFATTWISLANWLDWIVCQRRTFPIGNRGVAERIGELIGLALSGD